MIFACDSLERAINVAPIRAEVELTQKCGLTCSFCYAGRGERHSELTPQILDKLYAEGVFDVILTGGEPLEHPDFAQIAEKASDLFPSVKLQTNGLGLTREIVKLINDLRFRAVCVSLHGPASVHDQLTGVPGSYERAWFGLMTLLESSEDILISSNFVLTALNWTFFRDHLEKLYETGVKAVTITRFVRTGSGISNPQLLVNEREILVHVLQSSLNFMESHKGMSIQMANAVPVCVLPAALQRFASQCPFGKTAFYIDIDGNVIHCGMLREVLGNLLQSSFKEIKQGSSFFARRVSFEKKGNCVSCDQASTCEGGCRAAAWAGTSDLTAPDPLRRSLRE